MSDIVERLRAVKSPSYEYQEPSADGWVQAKWVSTRLAQDAADELERLRAGIRGLVETHTAESDGTSSGWWRRRLAALIQEPE